jgi:hypothetical protein
LDADKISYYEDKIESATLELTRNIDDANITQMRKDISKAKRKKDSNLKKMQSVLAELVGARDKLKKGNKKTFAMLMTTISTEIYADCGLNEDEADAIGVANYLNKFIKGE